MEKERQAFISSVENVLTVTCRKIDIPKELEDVQRVFEQGKSLEGALK